MHIVEYAINGKTYKVANNGTYYNKDTKNAVIEVLENCQRRNIRIQVFYGDALTGRDWNEQYDTIGYISRSMGPVKIPLMLRTKHSLGGGGLLDNCILKIRDTATRQVLYVADNYQQPKVDIIPSDMSEYAYNTVINGVIHGRHKTLRSANLLKNKLQ